MSFECKIGRITVKNYKDFKLTLDEVNKEYQVVSNKDGFCWGTGKSTKGAVISACRCGVRLKDIDIRSAYVPLGEVVQAIKE